jgi:hypothetical protein
MRTLTWSRELSPSFIKRLRTWVSTVRSPITSSEAICRLVRPCATSEATSRSRRVRAGVCAVEEVCSGVRVVDVDESSPERAYSIAAYTVILCPSSQASVHAPSSSWERASTR